MHDLVQFLRDRLDEDERLAQAAKGAYIFKGDGFVPGGQTSTLIPMEVYRHIARQGPERTLAEVEAKRRIVQEFEHWDETTTIVSDQRDIGVMEGLEDAMRLLALPYSDHPDYRAEWRP